MLVFVLCILANAFLIVAIRKHKPLSIPPNYYLASLAVTDILMGISVLPTAAYYSLNGRWGLGSVACKV